VKWWELIYILNAAVLRTFLHFERHKDFIKAKKYMQFRKGFYRQKKCCYCRCGLENTVEQSTDPIEKCSHNDSEMREPFLPDSYVMLGVSADDRKRSVAGKQSNTRRFFRFRL
jgi:hypothetical protein